MSSKSRSVLYGLSLASVVLVASTMRSPIVGLSGVLDRVVADLDLSALVAGSLTTIPVLAFAVCTPIAAYVIRNFGYKFAITLTLLGIALGIVVRSAAGTAMMLTGTILIGLFITLGNVTMPVMIRARFPIQKRGLATALYTTSLNLGAMLMLITVVPISDALGWQLGLLIWVVHVAIALAVWVTTVGFSQAFRVETTASVAAAKVGKVQDPAIVPSEMGAEAMAGSDPNNPLYLKDLKFRLAVMTLAFAAQSFCYYSVTAWLPQILAAGAKLAPESAAAAASVFQLMATVGAFGIPILARQVKYKYLALALGTGWLIFAFGMLIAPTVWVPWLIFAGIAQGGAFTLVMVLMVQLAKSDKEAARFSALVQGIGYALAATGPSLLGFAFDKTGSWNAPLYIILGAVVTLSTALYLTTRDSEYIKYK